MDKILSPTTGKSDLLIFNGRLTNEELLELLLQQVARMAQTRRFIKEKSKNKSGEIRKAEVKNEFVVLCKNLFRTFPSLPGELAEPCNFYDDLTSSAG